LNKSEENEGVVEKKGKRGGGVVKGECKFPDWLLYSQIT
jgi:hypothetical protein